MNHEIDIQIATVFAPIPKTETLHQWVSAGLDSLPTPASVCLRLVEEAEIQALNQTYRHKNKPTNVLSFPFHHVGPHDAHLLGDIVIAPSVLATEAQSQNKPLEAHWAHIVIHGCLHLLGYDHIHEEDANKMQKTEREILGKLGFDDPYPKKQTHDIDLDGVCKS